MNYKRIYEQLCKRGQRKRNIKSRLERHHIVPRHVGGDNSTTNLTKLTHKEHTIAHHLLYKMYGRAEDRLAYYMMKGRIKDIWADGVYAQIMRGKVVENLKNVNRIKQKEASKRAGLKMYRDKIGIHAKGMHKIDIEASQKWAKDNPRLASERSVKSHKNRTRLDYVKMANTKSKHIIIAPDGTEYKSVAEAEYNTGIARTTIDNWSRRKSNNWNRRPNSPIE